MFLTNYFYSIRTSGLSPVRFLEPLQVCLRSNENDYFLAAAEGSTGGASCTAEPFFNF